MKKQRPTPKIPQICSICQSGPKHLFKKLSKPLFKDYFTGMETMQRKNYNFLFKSSNFVSISLALFFVPKHGLWTPREIIAFTARLIIQFQFQIFRYSQSIFCWPHWPNFSDIFDLCPHWVSAVHVPKNQGTVLGLWELVKSFKWYLGRL